MTDAAAVGAPAAPNTSTPNGAPNPAPNPEAQGAQNGAPPVAKPRPESPLVYDEAIGKWVAKTKVDGTERVVPWEDLHRDAQRARSADERFEEAKQIKLRNGELTRAALAYQEALKNPQQAYELWAAMGLDPNEMLERLYTHAEAEAKLTPEARKLREYERREAEAQEQRRQQEALQREQQEREEQAAHDAKYERAFGKHMSKLGVPEDPLLRGHINHIVWAMHDMATEKGQTMGVGEAVGEALTSMKQMTKAVVGMMTPQERVAFLGPEIIEELVASRLVGAAPIPAAVGHHSHDQSRAPDGKFSTHTIVRPGSNFFGR